MTSIETLALDVPDPTAANACYTAAFGLDTQVAFRESEASTTGFRGFTTRQIDEIVLLSGVTDVAASKRFDVDRGLEVAKSFGRKYVQFATGHVKLALYRRRTPAKDAGVSPEDTGSHRIVIGSDTGSVTGPDGFAWEPAGAEPRPAFTTAATAIPQAP